MNIYCNLPDLINRFGERELIELTDRNQDDAIDTASTDAAMEDAASIIDSYLLVRYCLPLASVPVVLRNYACDIAMYNLWNLRRMGDIETIRTRYEDAIRWLERVRDYKAEIIGAKAKPAVSAEPVEGPGIHYSGGCSSKLDWNGY